MHWTEIEEKVRFNEVDQWGMAWHGHYLAWFEIGRMALVKPFDLLPDQMVAMGYIAPVVRLNCEYKQSAVFGDDIIIRTTAAKPEIAALMFHSEVVRKKDRELLAKGDTMQILMTVDKVMLYRLDGELEQRINRLLNHCGSTAGSRGPGC